MEDKINFRFTPCLLHRRLKIQNCRRNGINSAFKTPLLIEFFYSIQTMHNLSTIYDVYLAILVISKCMEAYNTYVSIYILRLRNTT